MSAVQKTLAQLRADAYAAHADHAADSFRAAGYFLEEFLNVWMRHVRDLEITIANGRSINGDLYEVQVFQNGQDIAISDGDQTVESAIAFAAKAVA